MKCQVFAAAGMVALATSIGCAGPAGADRSPGSSPGSGERLGNVTVVQGQQLRTRGGDLLGAMVGRVNSMRVERGTRRCPQINFRGQKTIVGNADVRVYVDGTPMVDTCILDQISVVEVARVEVYRNGFTNRPGYRANPNGLILVFLVSGETYEP